MIDLRKLEVKFDAFFEKETEESFNNWLQEKRKKEYLALLGLGELVSKKTQHTEFSMDSVVELIKITPDNLNCLSLNVQYAMAA